MDVQNRVSIASGRLPNEGQDDRRHDRQRLDRAFVVVIGVYSEPRRVPDDASFLSNYVDVYIRDSLKRIKGVSDVLIFAERKYAMRVWLDPVLLASRRLTAADVVSALEEQNLEVAAGSVG